MTSRVIDDDQDNVHSLIHSFIQRTCLQPHRPSVRRTSDWQHCQS